MAFILPALEDFTINLNHLKDKDLLTQMRQLIQSERDLVVSILHHLREIERRRLFADLGYGSLFVSDPPFHMSH